MLHAIGSCLSVGIAYNGAAKGIKLKSLNFEIEGDINLHVFLGLASSSNRAGCSAIRVKINIDSDASRNQEKELCQYVENTSPLLDCVRNPVPVYISLG